MEGSTRAASGSHPNHAEPDGLSPERYEQVAKIYRELGETPVPERSSYLDRVCGEDQELRREVDTLLRLEEDAAEVGGKAE